MKRSDTPFAAAAAPAVVRSSCSAIRTPETTAMTIHEGNAAKRFHPTATPEEFDAGIAAPL